jgi:hypothetical protein
MQNNDLNEWTNSEYAAWLEQIGGGIGSSEPCEANVVAIVSDAIREQSPKSAAQLWVDAANMCLAMADKTLGAQGLVSTSVVLTKH